MALDTLENKVNWEFLLDSNLELNDLQPIGNANVCSIILLIKFTFETVDRENKNGSTNTKKKQKISLIR